MILLKLRNVSRYASNESFLYVNADNIDVLSPMNDGSSNEERTLLIIGSNRIVVFESFDSIIEQLIEAHDSNIVKTI